MKAQTKKQGFSIVELMVVMAIFTMIVAAIVGVIIVGNKSWMINENAVDIQQQGRLAMETMSRELSQAIYNNVDPVIETCSASSCLGQKITFQIPVPASGGPTVYKSDGNIRKGAYSTIGAPYPGGIISYFVNPQHQLIREVIYDPAWQGTRYNNHNRRFAINFYGLRDIFSQLPRQFCFNSTAYAVQSGGSSSKPATPSCPDGKCNGTETCATCSQDCKCPLNCPCVPFCGDQICNNNETCVTCGDDCGACAVQLRQVIAQNVKSLTFTKTNNVIYITLPMEKTTPSQQTVKLSLGSRIVLKNYSPWAPKIPPSSESSKYSALGGAVSIEPISDTTPTFVPPDLAVYNQNKDTELTVSYGILGNGICEAGESACNGEPACGSCVTGGGTCFLAGTPILLANGKSIPIEKIKLGDEVMSFDEKNKQFAKDKVVKLLRHQAEGYLIINGHLKVTPEHSFYSNGQWVLIGALKIGDSILTKEGKQGVTKSIKKIKQKVAVYNFEVSPYYHTYIADGYVVHNAGTGKGDLSGGGKGGGSGK